MNTPASGDDDDSMAGQNNTLVSGDNDSMTGQYEYTSISSTSRW